MGGLHVPFPRHPHHEAPHKQAVAWGTVLCFEEPLPQEFHMTPSGSLRLDADGRKAAKCGSSAPRLYRHKAVLSPVALTSQAQRRRHETRRLQPRRPAVVRCSAWLAVCIFPQLVLHVAGRKNLDAH